MSDHDPATLQIEVDELGSHFVLRTSRAAVAAGLPEAAPAGDDARVAPAIPAVAAALRALVDDDADVELEPRAGALLDTVGRLPETASAVAHLCEHKPGRPGVVIAAAREAAARAALGGLPEHRHDPTLDRWWIPANDEPLAALGDALDASSALAATPEVHERLGRFEQPSLTMAAVAGLELGRVVEVGDGRPGERRLRLCRRCHPELEAELREAGLDVSRSFDSWWVAIDAEHARLRELLAARPELDATPAVLDELDRAAARASEVAEIERLSAAREGPTEIDGVGLPLRPFQGAAVEYALRTRRTFLADEPGLGKTVQALASIAAADAFPALVVCPASLRLNWIREASRWLPDRTTRVAAGTEPVDGVDVHVTSFESLHRQVERFRAEPLRALVVDESHFCKNPAARRTKAVQAVADALSPDALVLLLTGTPIVNRPEELGAQLRILGRLDEVAGERTLARVHGSGRDLGQLNARLRRTCFVRRKKSEVLQQLPAKQRVVVPLELANRAEYRRLENDTAKWLREQAESDARFLDTLNGLTEDEREAAVRERGRATEQRTRHAQALVRIGKLTLLAARGKTDAAIEWISTILDADEKLVVFCRHLEIGDRLHAAFPTAALATGRLGADRRNEEIRRFQEDSECRLIVCSIDAAGVGVTLTSASNVAFVEMAWTPAAHDQAEDRVHRIGQREAVTAWYLLAADTIDEQIADAVERKRRLVDATSDGAVLRDEVPLDELLGQLVDRATG